MNEPRNHLNAMLLIGTPRLFGGSTVADWIEEARLKRIVKGTVQTLTCARGARVCWVKEVYIPTEDQGDAYAALNSKRHGEFFYTLEGVAKSVYRKPKGVDRWNG